MRESLKLNVPFLALINNYDLNRGGVTRIVADRATYLADLGYDSYVLTVDNKDNYNEIIDRSIELKRVSENVKFLNLFDYYKGTYDESINLIINPLVEIEMENYKVQYVDHQKYADARYFNSSTGVYEFYKRWREDGSLEYINYFTLDRKISHRDFFTKEGNKKSSLYLNATDGKKHQEVLYGIDEFPYLNIDYNSNEQPRMIFLLNRKNDKVIHFKDFDQLKTHWLSDVCNNFVNTPVVTSEDIRTIKFFKELDKLKAHKVVVMHMNHLEAPYKIGSGTKKGYDFLLDNHHHFKKIVVLTKKQQIDIETERNLKNMAYIPNPITGIDIVENVSKDQSIIPIICRLEDQKNVKDIIDAFNIIHGKYPNLKIHIYGEGSQKDFLQKRVEGYKLSNKIVFKGYSNDVSVLFAKGLFSVLASKHEGFGLTLVEAMINKTIFISYDTNYGPSDIIKDGETGFIIEQFNVDKLARKMQYLIDNPEIAIEMGKRARIDVMERFNKNVVMAKMGKFYP